MRILERLLEGPKNIMVFGRAPGPAAALYGSAGSGPPDSAAAAAEMGTAAADPALYGAGAESPALSESDHKLAQAILFIWGNIPRFVSRFQEQLYRIRRFRIRTGNRWRVLFERIKLHPAWF